MQEAFKRTPLMAFSPGTQLQVQILNEKGKEILSHMEQSVANPGQVDGNAMSKAHGLFWLWVLGVYEVLRTMDQSSGSLSDGLKDKIRAEKKYFAKIRMPFAKQEFQGKKIRAWKASFATGVCGTTGDIAFDIESQTYSAKASVERFQAFIAGLR